jgi:cobalt-zinc-cadmium efflux system membrane fusion protein
MNTKLIYIVLIGALLQACNTAVETTQDAQEVATTTVSSLVKNENIKIGEAVLQNISAELSCNGKIHIPPSDDVSVHSRSGGYITEINYLPGEYVKKGGTLMQLENPKLIDLQRIFLETSADLALAEKEFVRKAALKSESATSQRQFDEVLATRDKLQASYLGYKAELQAYGIRTAQLEKTNRYQTTVIIAADKSGYVSAVMVNKGQLIQPETPLMKLASDEHLHIELKVYSQDADRVKVGQTVSFAVGATDEKYTAEVVHINPVRDANDGSLLVHCHFDKNTKIKAGMFVTAHILVGENNVLCLSPSALLKVGNTYTAYQVIANEITPITLTDVIQNKDWVSATEITVPGVQWITEGAYYVE